MGWGRRWGCMADRASLRKPLSHGNRSNRRPGTSLGESGARNQRPGTWFWFPGSLDSADGCVALLPASLQKGHRAKVNGVRAVS